MACIYNHLSLTDTLSDLELLFLFSRHVLLVATQTVKSL